MSYSVEHNRRTSKRRSMTNLRRRHPLPEVSRVLRPLYHHHQENKRRAVPWRRCFSPAVEGREPVNETHGYRLINEKRDSSLTGDKWLVAVLGCCRLLCLAVQKGTLAASISLYRLLWNSGDGLLCVPGPWRFVYYSTIPVDLGYRLSSKACGSSSCVAGVALLQSTPGQKGIISTVFHSRRHQPPCFGRHPELQFGCRVGTLWKAICGQLLPPCLIYICLGCSFPSPSHRGEQQHHFLAVLVFRISGSTD